MADKITLPNFNRSVPISKGDGTPTDACVQWWQLLVDKFNTIASLVLDIQAAQTAANNAQSSANAAIAAAAAAQAAADTANSSISSLSVAPVTATTVSTNTVANPSSYNTYLVDATAGPITMSLLGASAASVMSVTIKKIDSSAHAVIILAAGGDHINGASSISITTQYEQRVCTANGGTDWYA